MKEVVTFFVDRRQQICRATKWRTCFISCAHRLPESREPHAEVRRPGPRFNSDSMEESLHDFIDVGLIGEGTYGHVYKVKNQRDE